MKSDRAFRVPFFSALVALTALSVAQSNDALASNARGSAASAFQAGTLDDGPSGNTPLRQLTQSIRLAEEIEAINRGEGVALFLTKSLPTKRRPVVIGTQAQAETVP